MLIIILSLFITTSAFAQEVWEFYNGVRMLGMGGAQVAVVNDETALLANPAALGKVRDRYGTILDPEVEATSRLANIYLNTPLTQIFDLQEVANALNISRETPYFTRAQLFPSFVVKNFGIGIYGRYQLAAQVNAAGTLMTTKYWDDLALMLGYNFRFWDGRIKIGVTGKFISRIEVARDIDITVPIDTSQQATEGAAVGADVALMLAAPWAWLPTIAAVARDVGGTQFTAGKGLRMQTANGIPEPMTQDIDVGIAVFPIHTNHVRSTFTVEYQKMLAAAQATDKSRYYHLGYELNVHDMFFLRAGMNQKYWTAGLEFASERFQMQVATYGEDIGTNGTSQEDRRAVFKLAFRF